jgi:hypothetical protein
MKVEGKVVEVRVESHLEEVKEVISKALVPVKKDLAVVRVRGVISSPKKIIVKKVRRVKV